VDSVQLENKMIYLHGNISSIFYQALFYNSYIKDDIYKYFYLHNTNELDNEKANAYNSILDILKQKYNIIVDENYNNINDSGKHIVDDINKINFNSLNTESKYYFIQFSNMEGLGLIENKPITNNHYIFASGNPNTASDLGFLLRTNFFSRLLSTSFYSHDIFKTTKKKYRFDLSIRNFIDKFERIDLFNKLKNINHPFVSIKVNSYVLNKFKIAYEYLPNKSLFKNEYDFINSISENLIEKDEINDTPFTFGNHNNDTKLKRTLESDINILFESTTNKLYENDSFRNGYVSEKLVDNLLIGKPFINVSLTAHHFLKNNGFDDYSDVLKINYEDIFSDINTTNDKIMVHINQILNMNEVEYSNLLYRLKSVAFKNREKCLESFEKNSILEDIIKDKI